MVDPMACQQAQQAMMMQQQADRAQANLQQAMMTNQMNAQMTPLAQLAQFAQQNLQAPMSDLQNAFALSAPRQAASALISIDAKGRAEFYAERGEELIGHIVFWTVLASLPIIGWLADRTLARLASQLDAITDDVEHWAGIAGRGTKPTPNR